MNSMIDVWQDRLDDGFVRMRLDDGFVKMRLDDGFNKMRLDDDAVFDKRMMMTLTR